MSDTRTSPLIRTISEVASAEVERARGASIQVLLGPEEGMPRFYTRLFTLQPGGAIPLHSHPAVEHQQVVLEGEMVLTLDGEEQRVGAGQCLYIPAKAAHAYRNEGQQPVRFLCVVPADEDYATAWLEPDAPAPR